MKCKAKLSSSLGVRGVLLFSLYEPITARSSYVSQSQVAAKTLGSLSSKDGNGNENVT